MGSTPSRFPRWTRKRSVKRTSKPVNSWISFRTFYKNMFPGMPQKEASVHLKALWTQDPFKSKWTIVSTAYSKIRDIVTKKEAPLYEYLSLVCPYMGILSINDYLPELNWISLVDDKGMVTYTQIEPPNLSTLPEHILNTKKTGGDLIQFCAQEGFIDEENLKIIIDASPFIDLGAIQPYYMATQNQIPMLPSKLGTNSISSNQLVQENFGSVFQPDVSLDNMIQVPVDQLCGRFAEVDPNILEHSSLNYNGLLSEEISQYGIPDWTFQLFLYEFS